jgi:hypothetical protein
MLCNYFIYQPLLTFLLFLCLSNTSVFAQEQAGWKPLRSPAPRLGSIVANSTGTVIVAGESGAFISLNTGATWSGLNNFPPGRLHVSSSGDFYVFGAGLWRFNTSLQRFEQIALGNRSTTGIERGQGFITHLATSTSATSSTSATTLLLAIAGKGMMRFSAITIASAIATAITRSATITTSTVTGLATHPRTGEYFAVWDNTLWQSKDDGISWQRSTDTTFVHRSRDLLFGRTRLLQSGGASSVSCSETVSLSETFPLFCIDAMWERDDYTLFATSQGIAVQVKSSTPEILSTQANVSFLPNTPFGRGLRVLQFAESGNTLFAITERGVFCAEEIRIGKLNPFLTLPQKLLQWRECNRGLAGITEGVNIVHGNNQNSTQSTIITRSAWILRDSLAEWNYIGHDSLYIAANIQTPDSALLAFSITADKQAIMRSSEFRNVWVYMDKRHIHAATRTGLAHRPQTECAIKRTSGNAPHQQQRAGGICTRYPEKPHHTYTCGGVA